MSKFDTYIIWAILIFFGVTILFLWPSKIRMTEFCADKLYGYPEQIKKYDLKTKISKDTNYQNFFKKCEKELLESPQTFKIKYRQETLRYRANNWDTIFNNWNRLDK